MRLAQQHNDDAVAAQKPVDPLALNQPMKGMRSSHLADEPILVHRPPLLAIVYRSLGPHLFL
jgi:hypothetical protein